MQESILVLNAGSSSIKFSVFTLAQAGTLVEIIGGQIEGIGGRARLVAESQTGDALVSKQWDEGEVSNQRDALEALTSWLRAQIDGSQLAGVGHRVVHGGAKLAAPVLVDEQILETLDTFVSLAPLHQPYNLHPIREIRAIMPGLPQVACFDTAFHRTQPRLASLFALPRHYYDEGVRRYGFHGLSYEYIVSRLLELAPETAEQRVAIAHLGNGASMCAVRNGQSVTTSMGFTAVDGLPMGTRSGSLDPGVMLHLLQERGMSVQEVEDVIYKQSGLLGLSGLTNDMRELEQSENPAAREAIEYYAYQISRELGTLAAVLGGLDAFVFTAGIGENSALVRRLVCERSAWLGIALDDAANESGATRISAAGSRVSVWRVPTNEELMIARHTGALLGLL